MEIVRIGLLGGLLGLDATSVGQFMVSRPLVAGTLVGWALGAPGLGLAMGAMLELYLLVSFPPGGSRFPEGATATAVAVASAAGVEAAGAVPLAIGVGLLWGQVGGWTVTLLRQANAVLAPEPEDASPGPARIVAGHLGAIFADFSRAAVVTLTGVWLGRWLVGALAGRWPLPDSASWALLLVGGAVSAGILLRDMGGFRRRRVAFVAGLALGVLGTRFL